MHGHQSPDQATHRGIPRATLNPPPALPQALNAVVAASLKSSRVRVGSMPGESPVLTLVLGPAVPVAEQI